MKKEKSTLSPGRPRAFDVDEALEKAIELFWRQGYEGTSLTDLTTAMGINRPSLYAAFGNKEALFRKALDKYCEASNSLERKLMEQPVARIAVEQMLLDATSSAGTESPQGCLLVKGALECNEESSAIHEELKARRLGNEAVLQKRLERAKAEGELPADCEPSDLARYFSTVMQGFSIQAMGGAGSAELKRVVEMAMRAWPN